MGSPTHQYKGALDDGKDVEDVKDVQRAVEGLYDVNFLFA